MSSVITDIRLSLAFNNVCVICLFSTLLIPDMTRGTYLDVPLRNERIERDGNYERYHAGKSGPSKDADSVSSWFLPSTSIHESELTCKGKQRQQRSRMVRRKCSKQPPRYY